MKIKQNPEDFLVDEIYDLEKLKNKPNESLSGQLQFFYFILWKKDYTLNRAIEHISKVFKIQARDIHFAGTKDRIAVTTQIISMKRLRKNWQEDLEYFNNKNPDIKLKFLGIFPARINLGDNLGNKFKITVRDLTKEEVSTAKNNSKTIEKKGVLNYFDSQRFGFAGNNPIIGKYLIRGDFEKAFFHIITSIPDENQKKEHLEFIDYLKNNWKEILEKNDWKEALKLCPTWLNNERMLIEYVQKYKNDFLGAISLIHKKIRTMYVNSYQSYLFNETIKYLNSIGEIEKYEKLPLVASNSDLKTPWGKYVENLLSKDGLNLSYFEMKRSPTLKPKEIMRDVFIPVNDFKILDISDDELNEGKEKMIIEFSLQSGSYATNVIKCLFENN